MAAFPHRARRYGRAPATTRNLWIGAGILLASLTARSLDMALCAALPFGTHFGWHLDLALIARIWRGGCIIRSAFLDKIGAAYDRTPGLENLLFDAYFTDTLTDV